MKLQTRLESWKVRKAEIEDLNRREHKAWLTDVEAATKAGTPVPAEPVARPIPPVVSTPVPAQPAALTLAEFVKAALADRVKAMAEEGRVAKEQDTMRKACSDPAKRAQLEQTFGTEAVAKVCGG